MYQGKVTHFYRVINQIVIVTGLIKPEFEWPRIQALQCRGQLPVLAIIDRGLFKNHFTRFLRLADDFHKQTGAIVISVGLIQMRSTH